MKSFFYNNMTYFYDDDTSFIIQTGRYRNKYLTRHIRTGDYEESIADYQKLVISGGYKKRLLIINDNKETIVARQISIR